MNIALTRGPRHFGLRSAHPISNAHSMSTGLSGYWADPLATRAGRLLSFFLLYVSEGIPLGFTATVIATHMRREGLDPAVIGAYVGSLYLPWAFKWVFGPIVDTITSDTFGRRRTWIVGAQIAMMLALLAATPIDFTTATALFTAIIFAHNVCAAAQDVAIDALAVQVLPPEERGTANGFMFGGQSVGQAVGGAGILLLGASLPFESTYFIAVGLMALILVGVSWRLREHAAIEVPWSIGASARIARCANRARIARVRACRLARVHRHTRCGTRRRVRRAAARRVRVVAVVAIEPRRRTRPRR